jgi:hypothetical protein
MWYVVLTFKDDIFRSDFLRSFMQFQHHNITSDKWRDQNNERLYLWTIELCHIWKKFKHFFNRSLFLTTTNAMIYSSTFLRTTIPNLSQYVHYQCHTCSRRWIQNWSVWDLRWRKNELRKTDNRTLSYLNFV